MSGTYVAKPAAVVTPDVPPEWNPIWPFPGPNPPGYVPDYSLVATTPESIAYNGVADVSAILKDHTTYETTQPASVSVLAWVAKIGDTIIPLRFSGGTSYSSAVVSIYDSISGFWGAEPSLEFQLTPDQIGQTVTLRVASLVDGEALSAEGAIVISDSSYTCQFEASWGAVDFGFGVGVRADVNNPYSNGYPVVAGYSTYTHEVVDINNQPSNFQTSASSGYASITELPGSSKGIHGYGAWMNTYGSAVTFTFKVYSGGQLVNTYTKVIADGAWSDALWLTFDSATGAVNVINS